MVGVTGSMGPFFCEFTLNGDLLPSQYPATYAHELAHLLGITSEAEANFYAYQVCTRSQVQAIRFSGYLSVLPHVLNNARRLMAEEEYAQLFRRIRPEIIGLAKKNSEYWMKKYNPVIGRIQDRIYDLYLKGNKIESGRKNYSEVVGLLVLTTTTYSQELTEKEKARQEKEARKQAKENAKKEAKLKKAAKKDAKIADLRADYEEFLAEWEPIEANIGIAEVDTFFIHTNELFALLQQVEENTAFIEMVPEPYFDEEMGVTDTIWNAKNKNTNEPIAKNDALKVYSIATLNLTEAAARGVSLTAESVSALASLTSDPLKALTIGKKVKQATKAIKMSVNVIPLIQRNIKENTEKLKYKKANEGQEVKEE